MRKWGVKASLVEGLEVDNRPHAPILLGDQEQMGDLTWGLGVHCMNSSLLKEGLHLLVDKTSLLRSEVGATNLAGRRGGEGGKVRHGDLVPHQSLKGPLRVSFQ